mmetsp:Transcript_14651/g.31916  ORF Transcript_14651/g.31916 Transcript_14651/m.31916 type:complete len:209 (+) Transcript_14651:1201-1827(+)
MYSNDTSLSVNCFSLGSSTVLPATAEPIVKAAPAAIRAGSEGSSKEDAMSLPAKMTAAGKYQLGMPDCAPGVGGLSREVTTPVLWLVACMGSPGAVPGGLAVSRPRRPLLLFLAGEHTNVTRSFTRAGTPAFSVATLKVREVPSGALTARLCTALAAGLRSRPTARAMVRRMLPSCGLRASDVQVMTVPLNTSYSYLLYASATSLNPS